MTTTEKLAKALRDTLMICISRGTKLGLDDGGPVLDNARTALASYDADRFTTPDCLKCGCVGDGKCLCPITAPAPSLELLNVADEPRYRYAAKRINEGFASLDAEAVSNLLALCRELAAAADGCTHNAADDCDCAKYTRAALQADWAAVGVDGQCDASGAPDVIYLQLHGDADPADYPGQPVDCSGGDVSWCWEQIHEHDIRYVRADLLATKPTDEAPPKDETTVAEFFAGIDPDKLDAACEAYNRASYVWTQLADPDEPRSASVLRAVIAALQSQDSPT